MSSLVWLQSCQKQETVTKTEESLQLIEEIESLPNDVLRVTYSSLSSSEKSMLWTRHISKIVASGKYDEKQIAHIEKIKNIISEDLFSKVGTKDLQDKMDIIEKEWFWPAIDSGLFTEQDLLSICTSNGLGYNNSGARSNAALASSCNCRYSLGCGHTCEDTRACESTKQYDCGLLGTSRCTGACSPM